MKYVAIWFGVFAAAALGGLVLAMLWFLTQLIVDQKLWWAPAALLIAVLLATLAVSLEYLTEHRGEEPPQ